MESLSELNKWILKSKKNWDLRIIQQTWTKLWSSTLHDVEFSLNFKGHSVVGRGTGDSLETAFWKATSESIERAVLIAAGHTASTGFAAHPDLPSAKEIAESELIERMVCAEVFAKENRIYPVVQQLKLNLPMNLTSHCYSLGSANSKSVVATFVSEESPSGWICVGLGCENSLEAATYKSEIESVRAAAWLYFRKDRNDQDETKALVQIHEGKIWTDEVRAALGRGGRAANLLREKIAQATATSAAPLDLTVNVAFEQIPPEADLFANLQYNVVRAIRV